MRTTKYEYGGNAQGDLLTKVVRECAIIAARYRLRVADFDDVVQDALIACHLKQKFDEGKGVQLWTYMRRIVISAAHDACKKMVTTASREAQHADGHDHEVADVAGDPSDRQRRRLAKMTVAVTKLPPQQRRAVILRYGLDGSPRRTNAQVATAMGVKVTTTKTHLARAMSTLRFYMGGS